MRPQLRVKIRSNLTFYKFFSMKDFSVILQLIFTINPTLIAYVATLPRETSSHNRI